MYSKIVEKHVVHLEYILRKLKENYLFVNCAKNEFA